MDYKLVGQSNELLMNEASVFGLSGTNFSTTRLEGQTKKAFICGDRGVMSSRNCRIWSCSHMTYEVCILALYLMLFSLSLNYIHF